MKEIRLSYLFDPLCGWCYGAAPAIGGLMRRSDLAVELLPTGLFADDGAFPMNDGFAAHAWEADQRIARLSGQRFSEAYRRNVLANRRSCVDSGPATLALTAVRMTAPEREFEALHAIQRARYEGGRDNGDAVVVADILDALALGDASRRICSPDDELLSANRARITEGRAAMQRFGARGVPALIAGEQEDRRLIDSSLLYRGADALAAALTAA